MEHNHEIHSEGSHEADVLVDMVTELIDKHQLTCYTFNASLELLRDYCEDAVDGHGCSFAQGFVVGAVHMAKMLTCGEINISLIKQRMEPQNKERNNHGGQGQGPNSEE